MARVFSAAFYQYLELSGDLPALGPPFWISLWIKPAPASGEECIFYLGSTGSVQSYFALAIDAERRLAAVSASPWHGRAEATTPTPVEPGHWHGVVAQWPASSRREVWTSSTSAVNTATVSVPFVDKLTVGRRSSALPGAYLTGALAYLAVGVGVLGAAEVAALCAGVDARLAVARPKLRAYWALDHGDYDLIGGRELRPHNGPTWEASLALVGPIGPTLLSAGLGAGPATSGFTQAGAAWALACRIGRAFSPGALCGKVYAGGPFLPPG